MQSITVRAYGADDRDAVRRICFETGFMGSSIVHQYRDFESYVDMFTSYYTDVEPENAFVAVMDGQVVGYALSTLDVRRASSPLRIALRHALTRLACFRPGTFRFYLRCGFDLFADLQKSKRPSFDLRRYPSEVHINLLPHARNGYAARELMFQSFDRLAEQGSPGVHGEALGQNKLMINFWNRTLGGQVIGHPYPVPGLRTATGGRVSLALGLRSLDTWAVSAWKQGSAARAN